MRYAKQVSICLAILVTLSLPLTSFSQVWTYKGPTTINPTIKSPGFTPEIRPEILTMADRHWDFEDGTLQGFQHENAPGNGATGAFHNQPTFGDNVSTARALNTRNLLIPPNPCTGLVLDEATTCESNEGATFYYLNRLRDDFNRLRSNLDSIGGSYSNTVFPIGKQGLYWIGSYENRPSRRILAASVPRGFRPRPQSWGSVQRDRRTGRLVSPLIELRHKYFHLLVGGGCSRQVGVYLQQRRPLFQLPRRIVKGVPQQGFNINGRAAQATPSPSPSSRPSYTWKTLRDASGQPIEARGFCMENMIRVSFDISHLAGTKARILIEDKATGSWGHINVDDIWLSNKAPQMNSRDTDPVWGIADLHAHLMNEKGFTSYTENGAIPESRLLWGSALGPLQNLQSCNDTHTTNNHSYGKPADSDFPFTYTLCRDACLNLMEGAGLPEAEGDQIHQDGVLGGYHNTDGGYPNFKNWPMWYSSIHQQMHWSWIRRAYNGGLRMMIAAVGNSEALSFALNKKKDRPFTSDQDALALQIPAIKEFAEQNSDWIEVVYTPRQARRIINLGKLAIVIGVELDHIMDSCDANITRQHHHTASEYAHPDLWASQYGVDIGIAGGAVGAAQFMGASTRIMHYSGHPRSCTPAQIEARLDSLYHAGVRQVIPLHFSNNLFGGYAINGGLFVANAVFGDPDARPPTLMSQEELTQRYGDRVNPFEPLAREPSYGENQRRLGRWQNALPFSFKLDDLSVPIWAKLGPESLVDANVIPPGIGRTIAEFFTGQCIEDEGWRIFTGIISGGASEAACASTALTNEMLNSARSNMPFEGATDTPLMIPMNINSTQNALSFHINARGLTSNGRTFINAMMSRGILIDIQHSSEKTKTDILALTGAYPVMASHGGVQPVGQRLDENVLSGTQLQHVYSPPGSFAGGLVGLGVQSSYNLVDQIGVVTGGSRLSNLEHEIRLQMRGVALGSDFNGIDWHSTPRFGRFAYYHEDTPRKRSARLQRGEIGAKVNYADYPAQTNPWANTVPTCEPECSAWSAHPSRHRPINAHQVSHNGRVTRTFDINYDGLAHYGLIPDFLQEISILGVTREQMGAVFRSSETLIKMWEESCFLAYQRPNRPRSLVMGCGPISLYQ